MRVGDAANAAEVSADYVVLPSRDDPVVAAGSDGFGGAGRQPGPRAGAASARSPRSC